MRGMQVSAKDQGHSEAIAAFMAVEAAGTDQNRIVVKEYTGADINYLNDQASPVRLEDLYKIIFQITHS